MGTVWDKESGSETDLGSMDGKQVVRLREKELAAGEYKIGGFTKQMKADDGATKSMLKSDSKKMAGVRL